MIGEKVRSLSLVLYMFDERIILNVEIANLPPH
jgi:hypothetical protein